MMKIMIFGGTFNPVHNGHVRLCRMLSEKIDADLTIVIPAYAPVHKSTGSELAPCIDRLAMCHLAFDGANTVVSDIEIAQGKPCYTCDTLERIAQQYPNAELYLACGSDMFLSLHEWRNPERIYSLATVCAIPRADEFTTLNEYAHQQQSRGLRSVLFDAPALIISSTQLRSMIRSGDDVSALVPQGVAEYIKEHRLYK